MVLEEVKERVGKMKTNKEGKGSGGDIEMIVCGKLKDFFLKGLRLEKEAEEKLSVVCNLGKLRGG
jgi:hypothetical protein